MVSLAHKITEKGCKDVQELPAGICQIGSPQSANKFSSWQGTSQIIPVVETPESNTPNENRYDAEVSATCSTEEILLRMTSCNDDQISQHTLTGDFQHPITTPEQLRL